MTSDQRRLVQQSFETLRDEMGAVSLLFYGRLFELDPSARRLFHNDLAVQGRKLTDTLDWVVKSLDQPEALRAPLGDLGRKHSGFGVTAAQYETVITAILWAIAQALGPDFDPATRAAWRAALDAVGAAMKEGAARP